MRIKNLSLINFKRFTELSIEEIPENSKLVLLIGANGSGKSSVFDAFTLINTRLKGENPSLEEFWTYFNKETKERLQVDLDTEIGRYSLGEEGSNNDAGLTGYSFYGRTSFRQVSRLTRTMLGQGGNISLTDDSDRPKYFIDKDNRFENDIEKITETILKDIFRSKDSNEQVRERYIQPINNALFNIFGLENGSRLELIEIIPPLEGKIAQITFRKGVSEIHYNLLSAGEKEAVNILFNLLTRSQYFSDTVYYFDEMDLHLNTKLQYNLLKEITLNWIPDNCQLWTASHSLGFIEFANDYEQGCIIDFDEKDFDRPQVLKPTPKNNFETFEIAVSKDFLDRAIQGRRIIFSENMDTVLYNDLRLSETFFFKANDKRDVFFKARDLGHYGLIDRDYLTDQEVREIQDGYPFLKILPYYSIENLLYHPENLDEFFRSRKLPFYKAEYISQVIDEKNRVRDDLLLGIRQARDGYPFYKENEKIQLKKVFQTNDKSVAAQLKSDDFETFFKVFPAKDYGGDIRARQNLRKQDLAKTEWFKSQIIRAIE